MLYVLTKTLTISGYVVDDLEAENGDYEFYKKIPQLIKDGTIAPREEIYEGLELFPELLIDVLKGDAQAKPIIKVC